MVLETDTVETIQRFVQQRPRAMQEIADKVDVSWRTADRYVKQIATEEGTIDVHTFREGTRGALKIVYYRTADQTHTSQFKELLAQQIQSGREKTDFSPFDVYQAVDQEKREAFMEQQTQDESSVKQDLTGALRQAEEEILIFSGDLSWANITQDGTALRDVFAELGRHGVTIKILGTVDVHSKENTENLLSVNTRIGSDMVQVRHHRQPLRAFIVDSTFARFKERKTEAAQEDMYVFYEIREREWVDWIRTVFHNLYRGALPAEQRLQDLETIQHLDTV